MVGSSNDVIEVPVVRLVIAVGEFKSALPLNERLVPCLGSIVMDVPLNSTHTNSSITMAESVRNIEIFSLSDGNSTVKNAELVVEVELPAGPIGVLPLFITNATIAIVHAIRITIKAMLPVFLSTLRPPVWAIMLKVSVEK
jgi:hypothetical protein